MSPLNHTIDATTDAVSPRRPLDVWRVCGQDITTGCTCPSSGPSHTAATKAVERLAGAE